METQTTLQPTVYEQKLVRIVHKLPHERVLQLVDFAHFLELQITGNNDEWLGKEKPVEKMLSPRILGLHEGQGWMSDDFNEPLSEQFWMGEE